MELFSEYNIGENRMGYVENLRSMIGHQSVNLVGVAVIILDEAGKILLQKRNEPTNVWGLPGGLMELGESASETAKRETFEETGLIVGELELIDVFSGPDYYVQLANGDEYYVIIIAYSTRSISGCLKADGNETLACEFVALDNLPGNILNRHQKIIDQFQKLKLKDTAIQCEEPK